MARFRWPYVLLFTMLSILPEKEGHMQAGDRKYGIKAYELQDTFFQQDCLKKVGEATGVLAKYQILRDLQNWDDDEFYSCLINHVDTLLPVVYTPGVAEVCENYKKIKGDRGIILKITESDKIKQILTDWRTSHPEVTAIVVTDGGRILGLGDLGANGMGIPVGKMALYSALGGVHPKHCLPVTLDVGIGKPKEASPDDPTKVVEESKEEKLRKNRDLYVGLEQERTTGQEYYKFVDEFVTSAREVFGPNTLIQFEDFANENAFKFLHDYKDKYVVFNDDIQGTAAVAVAGILAAEKVSKIKLQDSKILFAGAGEAGIGIANLMVRAMVEVNVPLEEARKKIYMKRRKYLITDKDSFPMVDGREDDRIHYRQKIPEGKNIENLVEIIKWVKPNILIGVSSVGGLFTKEVLEEMANINKKPIIFSLSNPLVNSECTAEAAYKYTKGTALFASGSPFDKVKVAGKFRYPRQCNNAYIFPGVGLAITAVQMTKVPEEVFLIAAKTLANKCTQESDLKQGSLFPKLGSLRECSIAIATNIAKYAFKNKLSALEDKDVPKEEEVEAFIRAHQYRPKGLSEKNDEAATGWRSYLRVPKVFTGWKLF